MRTIREEALIVNPCNVDDVVIEERKERHVALLRRVKTHDVVHWRKSVLEVLSAGVPEAVP